MYKTEKLFIFYNIFNLKLNKNFQILIFYPKKTKLIKKQ